MSLFILLKERNILFTIITHTILIKGIEIKQENEEKTRLIKPNIPSVLGLVNGISFTFINRNRTPLLLVNYMTPGCFHLIKLHYLYAFFTHTIIAPRYEGKGR